MVGMSLSIMLAVQRIKKIACERHATTAIRPREALVLTCTIEIFPALGIMNTIIEESEKYYPSIACWHQTLPSTSWYCWCCISCGKEIASHLEDMNAEVGALTPCLRFFIDTTCVRAPSSCKRIGRWITVQHWSCRWWRMYFRHQRFSIRRDEEDQKWICGIVWRESQFYEQTCRNE